MDLLAAVSIGVHTVILTFSEPIAIDGESTSPGAYGIDGGLVVSGVLVAGDNVRLTTSTQLGGKVYTVQVLGALVSTTGDTLNINLRKFTSLLPSPAPGPGSTPTRGRLVARPVPLLNAFLGGGILRPFRRDQKNDFAHGSGEVLVRACVEQVLGTLGSTDDASIQGELPWRPEFGSVLYRLKQRNNDPTLQQLARVYIADALARWEPRVVLKSTLVTTQKVNTQEVGGDDALVIRLVYDIIKANVPGNQVVIPDVAQSVALR